MLIHPLIIHSYLLVTAKRVFNIYSIAFLTIVQMFPDADSPSRKNAKNRSFQHWIIVNIPGNNVAAGEILTECKKVKS